MKGIDQIIDDYHKEIKEAQFEKHILTLLRETPTEFFDINPGIQDYEDFINLLIKFNDFEWFKRSTNKINFETLAEVWRDIKLDLSKLITVVMLV